MSNKVVIRKAQEGDFKHIFKLIKELAEFEKLEDQVNLTEEKFISDGNAENPKFYCFLAEDTGENLTEVIGYALYYFVYSSFRGKSMYLEDVYVKPNHRGNGVGKRLYRAVGKEALDNGCCRMDFIVLNWNEKAIKFHKDFGAEDLTTTEKWHLFRLQKADLQNMMVDI